MTTLRSGVAALALALIALGILGLGNGDFAMVWQPVPAWVPLREPLAYLFAAASLAAGLGLSWRRTAAPACATLRVEGNRAPGVRRPSTMASRISS